MATLDRVAFGLSKTEGKQSIIVLFGTDFKKADREGKNGTVVEITSSSTDGNFVWTGYVRKVNDDKKSAVAVVSPVKGLPPGALQKKQTDLVSVTVDKDSKTAKPIEAELYTE